MSNMPGMANMPGMVMPGNSGGDAKPAPDTSTTSGAMPGMAMNPADPMAGMNMATANMAAMMPGGYHLDCTAKACTLIVSDKAAAAIPVLGLHVKLAKLQAGTISLRVNGKTVTIKQGKQVKIAGVAIRAEKISAHESTLRFSKAK